MVSIVQGKLGSGKSFHCTTLIVRHLLSGGCVATNMAIDFDAISRLYHRRLSRNQLIKISATDDPTKIPRGDFRGVGRRRVLVFLDEALNWFASQGGARDDRKSTWGEWLRQSDKLGQDVFFVAQNFERSAKWIRELAQVLYSIVNLGSITFLRIPLGKLLHLNRWYAVTRFDVRSQSVLGWSLGFIDDRTCSCYRTSELFGFPASGNAYDSVVVYPPFKFPLFPFFLLAFTVVLSLFFCYG